MLDRAPILRRLVTIPSVLVLTIAVTALLPVLLTMALAVDLARRGRPAVAARLVVFGWGYLLGETIAILGVALAVALGGSRRIEAVYRLQTVWTGWVFHLVRVVFGLDFRIEGQESVAPGPILVLSRHVSLIDTLLPARFVTRATGIRLRYVLKRELLLDPALDLAGSLLPNHFVTRRDTESDLAGIRSLAAGLGPAEGVLIYPEGTRFSEEKRRVLVERQTRRGGRMYRRVLPPRPAGTLTLLEATGADVVVLAHRGLEGLGRVSDVWSGGVVNGEVSLSFRRIPRADIPKGRAERVAWLEEVWGDLDDWVSSPGA